MKSKTEDYKKIIVPIVRRSLPNAKIILYGSRARGDDRPGSDIDVALDAGSKIDSLILSAIIWNLEESSLPIKFDIVDLHAVSEHMKTEIQKDGVLWTK